MGRWSYGGKTEADGIKKIKASFLKKHEYFQGYRSGIITWTHSYDQSKSSVGIDVSTLDSIEYLRIHYTQTDNSSGEKKDFDYKIPLTTTPCRYGGNRYWFTCPWYKSGVYCGRRVETLYKDGDYFACRHCYNLTYESRNVGSRYRNNATFRIFDLDAKIDKLETEIKRRTWRGFPTRKQRKLNRLYRLAEINFERFKTQESLLKGLIKTGKDS